MTYPLKQPRLPFSFLIHNFNALYSFQLRSETSRRRQWHPVHSHLLCLSVLLLVSVVCTRLTSLFQVKHICLDLTFLVSLWSSVDTSTVLPFTWTLTNNSSYYFLTVQTSTALRSLNCRDQQKAVEHSAATCSMIMKSETFKHSLSQEEKKQQLRNWDSIKTAIIFLIDDQCVLSAAPSGTSLNQWKQSDTLISPVWGAPG